MTAAEWREKLTEQLNFDREYIPSFQTTIQILSEILEERDRVYTCYVQNGAEPVTEFTSDRGAVNMKPNPLLKQWQDLNTSALSYLRDLGLTAAGLRKLQGQLQKEEKKSDKLGAFNRFLMDIESEDEEDEEELLTGIKTE